MSAPDDPRTRGCARVASLLTAILGMVAAELALMALLVAWYGAPPDRGGGMYLAWMMFPVLAMAGLMNGWAARAGRTRGAVRALCATIALLSGCLGVAIFVTHFAR